MELTKKQSFWAAVCATQALIAVAAGAFGAHGLKAIVPQQNLEWWQTGCQYLMYHALAGFVMILLSSWRARLITPVKLFTAGSICFSGSLFIMTLSDIRQFGVVTPVGGLLYIVGWGLAIYCFIKYRKKEVN